jgi:hypothetical protein
LIRFISEYLGFSQPVIIPSMFLDEEEDGSLFVDPAIPYTKRSETPHSLSSYQGFRILYWIFNLSLVTYIMV